MQYSAYKDSCWQVHLTFTYSSTQDCGLIDKSQLRLDIASGRQQVQDLAHRAFRPRCNPYVRSCAAKMATSLPLPLLKQGIVNESRKTQALIKCAICLETLLDPVTTIRCMHMFCLDYYAVWAREHDTCHMCRHKTPNTRGYEHIRCLITHHKRLDRLKEASNNHRWLPQASRNRD